MQTCYTKTETPLNKALRNPSAYKQIPQTLSKLTKYGDLNFTTTAMAMHNNKYFFALLPI